MTRNNLAGLFALFAAAVVGTFWCRALEEPSFYGPNMVVVYLAPVLFVLEFALVWVSSRNGSVLKTSVENGSLICLALTLVGSVAYAYPYFSAYSDVWDIDPRGYFPFTLESPGTLLYDSVTKLSTWIYLVVAMVVTYQVFSLINGRNKFRRTEIAVHWITVLITALLFALLLPYWPKIVVWLKD